MLPSTCSREALLACPPFPPWNLPSFTVESTLFFMLSLWSPWLSPRCGSRPSWLSPPHDLVLWSDGSVPFVFGKGGSGVLANCSLCGHSFLFGRPNMFKFFRWSLRHSARSLLVSAAPTSLPFLFYYLTLVLSSPPRPFLHLFSYLKLCGRSGRNCLLSPPVLSGYNGFPDTRFSRGTTRLTSLPDGERYLRPPQSLVVSLLLFLVSTLVFSRTGDVMSLPNILTHRLPRLPLRNLCSVVMLAVLSLVFAAMDTVFF